MTTPSPSSTPQAQVSVPPFNCPPGAAPADPGPPPPGGGPSGAMKWSTPPPFTIDPSKDYTATVETSKGTFTITLKPGCAPLTVNNFIFLAKQHFYDGLTWHRYVPGFVIQGGDPTGTGAGGPGYSLWTEPVKTAYTLGTVAMAKGQEQSGSQIFISVADNTAALQPLYNLFGVVSSGMDVVMQLRQGDTIKKVTIS